MSTQLRTAVARIFQFKGKKELTKAEASHIVAFDLHWFNPAGARRLLEVAVATELLRAEGEVLRPTFDVKSVDVPRGFTPTKSVLEVRADASLFHQVLSAARGSAPGVEPAELVRQINTLQARTQLDPRVAALLVAARHGARVAALAQAVEAELLRDAAAARAP